MAGGPVWGDTDVWVATDAPELVYAGPPWPGLLIAIRVPAGEAVTVRVSDRPPTSSMNQVFASQLIVGGHGFYLVVRADSPTIPVETGNYRVTVWVDGETPDATRQCSIVLGAQTPRQLGQPRT